MIEVVRNCLDYRFSKWSRGFDKVGAMKIITRYKINSIVEAGYKKISNSKTLDFAEPN